MTVANFLTLIRLILCPFFLVIYIYPNWFGLSPEVAVYVLLGLFLISEASDAVDGYVARRLGQVSDLGKLLDPMADSISRTTAILTFTHAPVNLPILFVFILIYRDSVVSTLRTICALKGMALAARWSGKIKAGIQAIAIFVILLLLIPYTRGNLSQETLSTTSTILVGLAALYTIYSGLEYIYVNRSYIAKMMK